MTRLEDLQPNAAVRGVLPDSLVTVVSVQWFGSEALELTYKTPAGKVHRKVDAMERMRGVTRYTDDLKLPGMLHAKILRSPHPHAKIKSIDVGPALALPGVFAAVTGQDFKIPYGVIPWTPDENALAVTKVCHVGDGVAAIAAVDEDTANQLRVWGAMSD